MTNPDEALSTYLHEVERELESGHATEHTYRPALKALIEGLRPGVRATNEPKRVECGAPDFVVSRDKRHRLTTIGHIEAKDVGVSLRDAARTDQLKRYREALPNLLLTNYLGFRWFVNGDLVESVQLADVADERLVPGPHSSNEVLDVLQNFLQHTPEPIRTPQALAERMARLSRLARDVLLNALTADRQSDTVEELHKALSETLIPDLDAEQFADIFVQTLAYGLFAARVNHGTSTEPFSRVHAALEVPRSNPFLRKLFAAVAGPALADEPFVGLVDDLADLLADTDIEAVLRGFGRRTRREDPIVHFYETFLAAYNPTLRELRGVYYTPEPVVDYIVRSIDSILRDQFGVADGLADTSRTEDGSHRVLILDPACGTGTFLYSVVDEIRQRFRSRSNAGLWNGYVKQDLLPRLFGLELLMAPYAVAHLKMDMELAGRDLPPDQQDKWHYEFDEDDRLGIYLTNSLTPAVPRSELLLGGYISDEANAAAEVKGELPIMVVLGNPPYSGHSANDSWREFWDPEDEKYKRELTWIGQLIQDYYEVDGQPLNERNPKWLQDDYVKFIRFGQWRIEQTGAGVLGYITNHGYLDNPTFRGMRQSLIDTFSDIYLLDLHGNVRKRESLATGRDDENVFDIQQGVAIGIFIKRPDHEGPARVFHDDLWGTRDSKYEWLGSRDVERTDWLEIEPASPNYLFIPQDPELRDEYEAGWQITDIMPTHVMGFQTHRDAFVVDFDREQLSSRFSEFLDRDKTDSEVRRKFFGTKSRGKHKPGDTGSWKMSEQRSSIQEEENWKSFIIECLYRPFDQRWIFYHPDVVDRPRLDVLQHVLEGPNMCLLAPRQVGSGDWQHAFVSDLVAESCVVSSRTKEQNYVFPLYLYQVDGPVGKTIAMDFESNTGDRGANFNDEFIKAVVDATGLTYVAEGKDDDETLTAEGLFSYIYGILHTPAYLTRYAEFLRTGFPRVPVVEDTDLFRTLRRIGRALVRTHRNLEHDPDHAEVSYPVAGSNVVEQIRYIAPGEKDSREGKTLDTGRLYINSGSQGHSAQYFEGVEPQWWRYIVGSYQVLEKWLRDRKGRQLSYAELTHYRSIMSAIKTSVRLESELDEAIPEWPSAAAERVLDTSGYDSSDAISHLPDKAAEDAGDDSIHRS